MSQLKTVWFIDEDPDQRSTYQELLKQVFQDEAQICSIEPEPTIAEMRFVIDDPKTISIIIDEKLKDTGKATFFGLELAVYFRTLNEKIPIYILTNFASDYDDSSEKVWSVESVIDKEELIINFKTIKARMHRNVSFYNDYLGEQERRFSELLDKSLTEEISKEELKEFEDLQYIRMKSISADEISVSLDLDKQIQIQLDLIKKLEEHSN